MNIAVIGMGAIGPVHINALKENAQNIVALCDVDASRCELYAKEYNLNAKIFSDYVEMMNTVKIDAIHICTPHYLHAEMAIYALNRGIHVLCEKPITINTQQLDELKKAVESSSAQFGTCFQNRYNDSVLYVKEFLKNKKVISASANLVWERNADYYNSASWRGTLDKEGGAVLINQAVHSLDLLQWICGMPETVVGNVYNYSLKDVIEAEDTAFGIYTLKDGGNFIISATNAGKHCFPIYYNFQADGNCVELSGNNVIINGKLITKEDGKPIYGKEVWGSGHAKLIADFYDCIKNNRKFGIDFYEGCKSVIMLRGLYSSNGKIINLR